ncbi:MAG: hypothetical protein IID49_04720 [Proteobacteria bacterium]|nr:hypothetical protein [Pseudomonadota bacterium]
MSSQDLEAPPAAGLGHAPATAGPAGETRSSRHIFNPVVDFLCLGGASIVILPLMYLSPATAHPALLGLAFIVADFVNHPHFAHSYQIFYRGYGDKIAGVNLNQSMRIRYLFAGIVVPVAMIVFFTVALLQPTATMLGYGANLMLFLVGWHYTKQGFGMLIVDSVFKKKFFGEMEKKLFRYNAYACWWLYWLFANAQISERDLWGLSYYSFDIPDIVLFGAMVVAAATTLATLLVFGRKYLADRRSLPLTGVMAYLVTLYIWLFGRLNPAVLIFIPALHSLQYLLIVWRFEINRTAAVSKSATKSAMSARWRLAGFGAMGIPLGYLGFWLVPRLLNGQVGYDQETFGTLVFLFIFWIFINVHHYVIDNVIWRGENPETRAYLFGPRPA